MSVTPNMDLQLPTVGVTSGSDGIEQIIEAIETIDEHDHTTNKGVKITQAGINLTGNLELNDNHLTEVTSTRYVDQDTTLVENEDKTSTYFVDGDFYINNGDGTPVKVTDGTGLNLASVGTIGGDYGSPGIPASVVYTDLTKTFTFTQDTNTGAKLATSDILLYEETVSPIPTTLKSSSSLLAPVTITFPDETGTLATIDTDQTISGDKTFTGDITLSDMTASQVLAVDSNKLLVSIATTGTGSVVKAAGPTLTGNINLSDLTASQVLALDGSKNITSIATTGTGSVVKADAPAFSGVPTGTITGGSYTPTVTDVSGSYSISVATGYYTRVGNIVDVTISYKAYIAGSEASSTYELKASLPIASNFTAVSDAFGTHSFSGSRDDIGDYVITALSSSACPVNVVADAANDKIHTYRSSWSGSTGQRYLYGVIQFKYIVK